MKSRLLLSLVLGFSVMACTSSENEAELSEGLEATPGAAETPKEGEPAGKAEGESGSGKAAPAAGASAEGAGASSEAAEKAAVETGMETKAETASGAEAPQAAAESPTGIEAAVAQASEAAAAQVVYPTTSLLNLRQGPGTRHAVARKARFGEAINLSGETKGNWLKTSDGLWVSKSFTSASKPSQYSDPIVNVEPAPAAAAPAASEAEPLAPSAQ